MSSEYTPTLATEGIVTLDDVNTAIIGYHRANNAVPTRIVVSPMGRRHLDAIACQGGPVRQHPKGYRGSDFMAEVELPGGCLYGMVVEIDEAPNAPMLRAG